MIKKILLSFSLIVAIGISQSYAQRIMAEAIIGLNLSKVEGDLVNNGSLKFQKPGLNIGIGAILPFNDMFSLNIQTLFTQKGAYKKYGVHPDSALPYYKTRLDYAEVPILFSYHDKKGLIISTGVSYARLVRVKWVVNGRTVSNSINDGMYSMNNLDWIADFKYRLWQSSYINVRYQYGLTSIWSGDDEDLLTNNLEKTQSSDQRSSMISIRLLWIFGEKQSKQVRNETK